MSLTRARFESSGKTEEQVLDDLARAISAFRDCHGGAWEYETDQKTTMTTKDGYWGRATIRRRDSEAHSEAQPRDTHA